MDMLLQAYKTRQRIVASHKCPKLFRNGTPPPSFLMVMVIIKHKEHNLHLTIKKKQSGLAANPDTHVDRYRDCMIFHLFNGHLDVFNKDIALKKNAPIIFFNTSHT